MTAPVDTADLAYRLRMLQANRDALRAAQRTLAHVRLVMPAAMYRRASEWAAATLLEMDAAERRIEADIARAHDVTTLRAN